MSDAELVEVTQADRDAANAFWARQAARIIAGDRTLGDQSGDDNGLIQAFARHRIEALTTRNAELEAERDAAVKAERERCFLLALDKVRGTNADMSKTPRQAYQLCVKAVNDLRHSSTAIQGDQSNG